jgi:rhodanese-related sulfurtransferase
MTGKRITEFESATANPDIPGVLDISPTDLFKMKDQVCMIDVRRPEEYSGELGHVKGAKMIVLDTIPDHMDQIPTDQTIVFICRSGGRSARACAFALEEGLKSVYNLQGGMLAWKSLSLPTEK